MAMVPNPEWKRAAVILLGHGTEENGGSAGAVLRQAAALRERGWFAAVREAFWKQAPQIEDVLRDVDAPCVFIIPLFMAEGYFAARVIPEALGFAPEPGWPRRRQTGGQLQFYCAPVGTHPRLTEVALARAERIVREHPFPRLPQPREISLFLAGHGTERDPASRRSVETMAERIRALERYAMVEAVFLEETPRIPDCYTRAITRRIVVVPAFISDGLHTLEDIPVLLGESPRVVKERLAAGQFPWRNPTERHGHLVWYTPALGTEPSLLEVIVERIAEAGRPDPKPTR